MKKSNGVSCIVFIFLLICSTNLIMAQVDFVWGRQFGTDKDDVALVTVADQAGNVYVAGNTKGNLSGNTNGNYDGFLAKLDSAGNILWTRQFGTKENDWINWATIDKIGNIYLTGATGGIVDKQSYGSTDIWVVKFDSSGIIKWQQQYGTDSLDAGNAIYVNDVGYIYISGITKGLLGSVSFGKMDCFILKLDNDGNKIFVTQFGTREDDNCTGMTEDVVSAIYVCGNTFGDLAGKNKGKSDAFVGQFTDKGEKIRIIQFGTDNYDNAAHLIADKERNIYVGGSTGGDLAGKQLGEGDCFLAKINKDGEIIWTQQFGTEKWEGVLGIDLNEKVSGNIVVSGCQHWPACQSFIRVYKNDGSLLWVRNSVATGKYGGTCGKGVCFDYKGNVYHTGMTGGNLFDSVLGEHDIFVVKYEIEKGPAKP